MSVKVRLQRHGVKKKPFYKIVASDSRSPRNGRFIEKLGYYDPNRDPSLIEFNVDRLKYWYGVGAELTEQVQKLTKIKNIGLERQKTHKERSK